MFRQLLSYDYTNYGIKPHKYELRIIILLQINRFIQYHHVIHYFIASSWKNKTSNRKKCGVFVDIIRGCICLLTRTFFSFKIKPICFMAHEHFLRTCLFVWNWRAYIYPQVVLIDVAAWHVFEMSRIIKPIKMCLGIPKDN